MAAENGQRRGPGRCSSTGFNEAAAHGRGKHEKYRTDETRFGTASMRPRRMAAENGVSSRDCARRGSRFNEAAAHGRGKPARPASGY